jgi:hypothetical protein
MCGVVPMWFHDRFTRVNHAVAAGMLQGEMQAYPAHMKRVLQLLVALVQEHLAQQNHIAYKRSGGDC